MKEIKNELVPTIQYALGVVCGVVLVGLSIYLGKLLTSEPALGVGDYIQLMVLVVVGSALCVSIYVQFYKEKQVDSQVSLDKSIDLIKKAYDVLNSNGAGLTCERVSWVTAARLLKRAESLSNRLTLPSHKAIYESEHDYQRHRFGDLLKVNGSPLPTEFFLGKGYTPGSIGSSAYNTISMKGSSWIPKEALSVVYRFRVFPEGYDDPLMGTAVLTSGELDRLWLFDDKGVHDYFVFRHYFSATNSSVFRTKAASGSIKVSPADIDNEMSRLSGSDIYSESSITKS
ncbi:MULTISPECIES: hypothetical protein [Halorhodospira]|uniref:hypothetical protein n=1 Tax=Halorhodospira TaxID=85108 RepID=UPI001EE99B37|nr:MULTISPECIES: hypothetical protein [Halorhodospira]MCG5529071.1 hypothetical protein [Halorhodospira halophila]MCG5543186.1 hypothetical protein [Halorhodospira sp. 9628]